MNTRRFSRPIYLLVRTLFTLLLLLLVQAGRKCWQADLNCAFTQALRNHDNEIALHYLQSGADPNSRGLMFLGPFTDVKTSFWDALLHRDPTAQYATALMTAVMYDNMPLVKALLDEGAEVDASIPEGAEAVNASISRGNRAQGYTALIYACGTGDKELVNLLLQHGANVNVRACDGHTPLELATSLHYTEVVRLLQEAGATR